MKTYVLPLLLLPMLGKAQQPVTSAPQLPTTPPTPGRNQTVPIMPSTTQVPMPEQIVLPGAPTNVISKPLTADEAAKLALRVQPSLRLAEAQLLAAQGHLQLVRAGLLPTITVSATYGREIVVDRGGFSFPPAATTTSASTGVSSTSATPATTSGVYSGLGSAVSLKQLVFDFNHTRDLVRQADALEKAARHGLTLAQLNLSYAVKQSFYTYVEDQALVEVQQANVKNTQAELDLATAQVKAGLGAPANVVTAESAVGSAAQALSQAEQTELIAKINLALAIGVDPRTPIETSLSDEPAPSSTDVNLLVTQAMRQRPDLLQAQQNLRAAVFELSAAKTVTSPSLSLTVGATTKGTDQPFDEPAGALGLSVSWELYDGGVQAGTTKEARADLATAQSQLQTTTLTVVSDVSQSFVNLKTAEQQVLIAKATVSNAEEGVRLAEGRFKAGVAIFIEVTTAQATLVQAQSSLVAAQSAVQQARAQLHRSIGFE